MSQKTTPGYLFFVADFMNLTIEGTVYATSLVVPLSILWVSRDAHPVLLAGLVVASWLIMALTFTGCLVALKRLVGEIPQGRFFLTSSRSYKWMAAERINKMMVRSPFRSLVTENAFFRYFYYKGMGLQFDTTLLLGPRAVIAEPWAVTIGKGVVIGADAVVSAHKVERNIVTLEPIIIGDNVLIGTRAVVLPGAVIGNGVILGANSVVTRRTVIPDGETWAGNPAQKVDPFAFRNKITNPTTQFVPTVVEVAS